MYYILFQLHSNIYTILFEKLTDCEQIENLKNGIVPASPIIGSGC